MKRSSLLSVLTLVLCSLFGGFRGLDAQPIEELPAELRPFLVHCDSLQYNFRAARYQVYNIPFTDKPSIERALGALDRVRQYMDRELPLCGDYEAFSANIAQMQQFLGLALRSEWVEHRGRLVYFHFEEVPAFYKEPIKAQILAEVDRTEDLFVDKLELPPGKSSIAFFITDRRLMQADIGGAALGSFVWLPVQYALGSGYAWTEGVRESTVRHEIVHVFTNHTATNPLRHALPDEFIEGIALYLADNRIIEYRRSTSVRLSEDYMLYLRAFEFLEERAGKEAIYTMIQDVLTDRRHDFYQRFEEIAGQSYQAFVDADLGFFARIDRYARGQIRALDTWHRYAIVFGTLILFIALFLRRLPEERAYPIRINISVAFLLFTIVSLLTFGYFVELAFRHYFIFLAISLFVGFLIRTFTALPAGDEDDLDEESDLLEDPYWEEWDEWDDDDVWR